MEEIKNTQYYQILYDKDNKLAEYVWKSAILDLSKDDYKDILIEAYSILFDLPTNLLVQNFKYAVYPVTPEFQEWITKNLSKEVYDKIGLKKIAFVMPEDFLSKIGVELLIEHAKNITPYII